MRVKVFLEVTAEDGSTSGAAEVAVFEKQTKRAEDLGLSIAEGKALTAAIQQHIVDAQVATWTQRHRRCEACGARRHSKGSHPIIFMTLYGDVGISSPRLHRCPCQGALLKQTLATTVRIARGRLPWPWIDETKGPSQSFFKNSADAFRKVRRRAFGVVEPSFVFAPPTATLRIDSNRPGDQIMPDPVETPSRALRAADLRALAALS